MRKLLLLLLPFSVFGQAFEPDTVQPRILTLDQDSLHVDLSFKPREGRVIGTVNIWCSPIAGSDSLWLDAMPNIQVEEVIFNGVDVRWTREDEGIVVWPERDWTKGLLQVVYSSRPFKGVYFNGWNDPSNRGRKQIFTQGQGIDHRHWLPHQDAQNDKLKTSMTLFFEDGYEVLANGRLVNKVSQDGGHYWTYAMDYPHSSYLIAFVVGEYAEIEKGQQPFRAVYMYNDHLQDTGTTYYANEQIWNYLTQRIGYPYVWSTYRQVPVANFPHGGMENTTLTIYAEGFIADEQGFLDRNYVYVNAHELAHHWFGDLLTVPSSHDFWLHEGFATYYQMETEREVFGEEYYTEKWLEALRLTNLANQEDQFPLLHSRAGTFRFYQLGGLVLRALETEIGSEVFDEAVRDYLTEHAFGLVTTNDFKEAAEQACDCSLDSFFDGYVANPFSMKGHFVVRHVGDSTVVKVRVVNEFGKALPLSHLNLRLHRAVNEENPEDVTLDVNSEEWITFTFEKLKMVEIDPLHRYPITWEVDVPEEMSGLLTAFGSSYSQHLHAEKVFRSGENTESLMEIIFSRYLDNRIAHGVLDSMATYCPPDMQRTFLGKWFYIDELPPCSRAIGDHWELDRLTSSDLEKIQDLLESESAQRLLSDEQVFSYSLILLKRSPDRILDILDILEQRSGGMDRDIDLFHAYLTGLVKGSEHEAGVPLLLDLAGPSYSDDIRMGAWQMLAMLRYTEKDLRHLQYVALTSRHRHLRNAAKQYCTQYLREMDREMEIRQIQFALRDAELQDIERVERILDVDLTSDNDYLEQ